jgi:hypothetical protein
MSLISDIANPFVGTGPMTRMSVPVNSSRSGSGWGPSLQDSLSLSDTGMELARSGIDLNRSFVKRSNGSLDFQLEFNSQRTETLSATGYYSEETQEIQMSLSFRYQEEVIVDGRKETHWFEANLNVKASQVRQTSVSVSEEKEDILKVVRRIVEHIGEARDRKNTRLAGVVFDHEDFMDLVMVDGGRAANMLAGLVSMVVNYSYFLKRMEEGEDIQDVVLFAKRGHNLRIDRETNKMAFQEVSLSITDITASDLVSSQSLPAASQAVEEPISMSEAAAYEEAETPAAQ